MKDFLWRMLRESKPKRDDERRLQYVKALERLLLAATAGAFFFALARNIPVHAKELNWPADLDYTIDRVLRYLCLTWFLAYFFVSSVNNDQSNAPRDWKDIAFNVLQSISVLAATYALGFVLPDHGFGFGDGLLAFVISDAVVLGICVFALLFFRKNSSRGLNRVRIAGAIVAIVSAVLAASLTRGTAVLLVLGFLQLLLWMVWWAYFRLRLDRGPG